MVNRPQRLNRSLLVLSILIWAVLAPVTWLSSCSRPKPEEKKVPSLQHFTERDGLSSEMVYAIAVYGKEVWFGTYGGGASVYDKVEKTWKAYTTKGEPMDQRDDGDSIRWKNLLSYNHVSVILPDTDRIWFGTYFYGFGGGGISYYRPESSPRWKRFDTNQGRAKKIVSMALDRDSLWVGSEKGLNLLDKKREGWIGFYSPGDGLSGNFVNTIWAEPDFLWVGTNGGISRFQRDKKLWKTYSEKDGLTETEIKALATVRGRLWAGSAGGALFEYHLDSDRWKRIDPTDPCKNGSIHSITVAGDKVFVCRDTGVSIFNASKGQWECLTVSDGLLSNSVFCAAEDQDGIWFGTDKGVSKLLGSR